MDDRRVAAETAALRGGWGNPRGAPDYREMVRCQWIRGAMGRAVGAGAEKERVRHSGGGGNPLSRRSFFSNFHLTNHHPGLNSKSSSDHPVRVRMVYAIRRPGRRSFSGGGFFDIVRPSGGRLNLREMVSKDSCPTSAYSSDPRPKSFLFQFKVSQGKSS